MIVLLRVITKTTARLRAFRRTVPEDTVSHRPETSAWKLTDTAVPA